jgi:uncharacterized protein YidB (DUF937 family)
MGLMDVLNGMKNGPRGQVGSSATTGGMSPLTMGLLALLAYKALKAGGILGSRTAQPQAAGPATQSTHSSSATGDWLGGLGGLIGGGAAGSILTGGLGELVKKFQQSGQGKIAQSWIGTGPNAAVSPNNLEKNTIDSLTPDGRIPSEHEASRWA